MVHFRILAASGVCHFGFALGIVSVLDASCWPPGAFYTYYDCCRDQESSGLPRLNDRCFTPEFTAERCCTYRFGQGIYGLPYQCTMPPKGSARLDVDGIGRLDIQCSITQSSPLSRTGIYRELANLNGAVNIWMSSWLFSRLLVKVQSQGLDSLVTFAPIQEQLAWLTKPVDIDRAAVRLVSRNARRNGVRVAPIWWDVTLPPGDILLARGPFDVALMDTSGFVANIFRGNGSMDERLYFAENALMPMFLHLLSLGVELIILPGTYARQMDRPDLPTTMLLYFLARLPHHVPSATRACGSSSCRRHPTLTPLGWTSESDLAPPTRHGLIFW